MDERPRLLEPSASPLRPANVIVIYGFPWHTSEADVHAYLMHVHSAASPSTTRIYTTPTNGASRGICFVEYSRGPTAAPPRGVKREAPSLGCDETISAVCRAVEESPFERRSLRAVPLHLTKQNWDRRGRLPDLPSDPPPLRGGVIEGFGHDGFAVRCGQALGLANTVTPAGVAHMQALRKRLRAEAAERTSEAM